MVRARTPSAVIAQARPIGFIGTVVRKGQFVVISLGDPCKRDTHPRPRSEISSARITRKIVLEQSVVSRFVLGDTVTDLPQHGFTGLIAQRRIIRARTRFHDTTREQFAGLRATHRLAGIDRNAETGTKPREACGEIETGVGHLGPATQRSTMLSLLFTPTQRFVFEASIFTKNILQITDVVRAVGFDHRGSFHRSKQARIDRRRIEGRPCNVFEFPLSQHGEIHCASTSGPRLWSASPAGVSFGMMAAHHANGVRRPSTQ